MASLLMAQEWMSNQLLDLHLQDMLGLDLVHLECLQILLDSNIDRKPIDQQGS